MPVKRTTQIPAVPMYKVFNLDDVEEELRSKLIGQEQFIQSVIPRLQVFETGYNTPNRPAGVFLLLGPTGTGKTHSVSVLAEAIHNSPKMVLKIDCGEFQNEHEVAKLIGAPPGYLGHRETQPWITQQKVNMLSSDRSGISIILFDEIEKAAFSIHKILLGIMDAGTLRLGDASVVNFENCFIFLTSNCGASEASKVLKGDLGYGQESYEERIKLAAKRSRSILRRSFTSEFIGRIDEIIQFNPLSKDSLLTIVNILIGGINLMIGKKNVPAYEVVLTKEAENWLVENGTGREYGARDLRRTVEKKILFPLCAALSKGLVMTTDVNVDVVKGELKLIWRDMIMEASG